MLQEKLKQKNIILASQSPRRKELLSGIVSEFTTQVKSVDEVYPQELSNEEIAVYLSELKATVFQNELKDNDIVITADTIVCLGNEVLGKPTGAEEAIEMLKKLSGKTHEVITGVTLISKTKKVSFYDKTAVTFYDLTTEEITSYVTKDKPFDKAGSYGIQEWIGYIGIKEMKGDYYNVMGLPLHKLYRYLRIFVEK